MTEAVSYQCPNCDGKLAFNSTTGLLQCEFCDSAFKPEAIETLYASRQAKADAAAQTDTAVNMSTDAIASPEKANPSPTSTSDSQAAQHEKSVSSDTEAVTNSVSSANSLKNDPIAVYLARATWESKEKENLLAYNCSSCGAQLMVDKVTAVTSCPYCGNSTVIPGQLSDTLKPDFVIPFKFDKDAAIDALKNYYKGKKLLPNAFSEENHLQDIQGVYVPFWLYSGTGSSSLTVNARNMNVWFDSKNNYVQTSHFICHREGTMEFNHVPVDGSTKMPDGHMDAIEPFDYSELTPFSIGYLPGYIADRYDQSVEDCQGRAHRRITTTCSDTLNNTVVGFQEVDRGTAETTLKLDEIAYALFPVWMLHTTWKNKDYLFAMNGQTGKLVGDLPVDGGKVIKRFLMYFLPLVLIFAVLVYFIMGFGF